MKTTKKLTSILSFFNPKIKLSKFYDEIPSPKVEKKSRFVRFVLDYIIAGIFYYFISVNSLFESRSDKECFYNILKQEKYDFSKLLKGEGYYVLEDYLRQHKEHSHYDSWVSRHQITIVIDKMECSRTTSNFEKSKKLYKSENGHYLINRCFVVGDSEELYGLKIIFFIVVLMISSVVQSLIIGVRSIKVVPIINIGLRFLVVILVLFVL